MATKPRIRTTTLVSRSNHNGLTANLSRMDGTQMSLRILARGLMAKDATETAHRRKVRNHLKRLETLGRNVAIEAGNALGELGLLDEHDAAENRDHESIEQECVNLSETTAAMKGLISEAITGNISLTTARLGEIAGYLEVLDEIAARLLRPGQGEPQEAA